MSETFTTQEAVDYLNHVLSSRGAFRTKRDKIHVKYIHEAIWNKHLHPIDPNAPRKAGFTFTKEEIDRYALFLEQVKTANVPELLQRIEVLESELEQAYDIIEKLEVKHRGKNGTYVKQIKENEQLTLFN